MLCTLVSLATWSWGWVPEGRGGIPLCVHTEVGGTPGSSRDGISGRRVHEDFWGSGEENGKVSFSCKIEFITFNLQVGLGSQAGKKRKL